jgi:hypothetical protein
MKSSARPSRDTLWFASLLSGAYGSAAIALLFLTIDAVRGDPFFTPSLMGSVILMGATPAADLPIRLDAVAYFSIIHLVLFVALGAAATRVAAHPTMLLRPPVFLAVGIAAVLTLGLVLAGTVVFPGLLATMGFGPMLLANVGAAAVMAGFIRSVLAPRVRAS